jgi:hypothetical protein
MILDVVLNVLKQRLSDKRSTNPSLFADLDAASIQDFLKTKHTVLDAKITCGQKNWTACLHLLEQEMRKIWQYGISETELQRKKEFFISPAERNVLAAKTRHSNGLVAKLISCDQNKFHFMSREDFCAPVKQLNAEITAEDCQHEFAKIWQSTYVSVPSNYWYFPMNMKPQDNLPMNTSIPPLALLLNGMTSKTSALPN